jgi:hypothetical protein
MTRDHAKFIIGFIAKMGMYICPSDRQGVVAFIHGYEQGCQGLCTFTRSLSVELEKRHRIKAYAQGWPEQVPSFAQRRNLTWMEAFILSSSNVVERRLRQKDGLKPPTSQDADTPSKVVSKRKPSTS